MSGDDGDILREALIRSRKKSMKRAGLVGLGVAIAAVVAFLWPTAAKDLEAASPQIEARRAQYCAIYEALDGQEVTDSSGSGQRLVLPGFVFLDAADISSPNDGANADQIEYANLGLLCGADGGSRRAPLVSGVFEDLARDPSSRSVGEYERDGVAMGLRMLEDFEYLLVFRTESRARSQVRGGAIDPGSMSGSAFVYRLADAELIASTRIALDAPSSAFVYANQNARDSDLELSVNANATGYYQEALARQLGNRGLSVVIGR